MLYFFSYQKKLFLFLNNNNDQACYNGNFSMRGIFGQPSKENTARRCLPQLLFFAV